jgi:hypothetical protein
MSAAPFLIEVAIEPAAGGDIKTVLTVLSQLAADDASFGFTSKVSSALRSPLSSVTPKSWSDNRGSPIAKC